MRIACLYIPDLPLAALERAEPECKERPVVIADGVGPRAKVIAVSAAAARHGAVAGMSVAQARAVEAGLGVRTVGSDCQRATQAALCDVAYSVSPHVEDAGGGVVYLGADGLSALFPSEEALANALAQKALALGLDARVGLAATKVAAYLAARDGGGVAVIPPGEEWHFLAPLPVRLLGPSPELAATLCRWGIRTIGDLTALPARAVGTRLGPEGVALVHRARGEDPSPLMPRPAPLCFAEEVEFEYAIETLEPFLFVARRLIECLTRRLALRGFVCGDLAVSLTLVNRAREQRTIPVAAPSNDVKSLLALLRLHLEGCPPPAPVRAVGLRAVQQRLRAVQLQLFHPAGPAPERLAVTLARLTAICGADRVGAPMTVDSHWPDAYGVREFCTASWESRQRTAVSQVSAAPPSVPASSPGAHRREPALPLALRALRPPRSVEVFRDRGRLDYVRGDGLAGRVVVVAGPWRVQTDWWDERAGTRDYYDVQLSDGGGYRLDCARGTRPWFADGIYD